MSEPRPPAAAATGESQNLAPETMPGAAAAGGAPGEPRPEGTGRRRRRRGRGRGRGAGAAGAAADAGAAEGASGSLDFADDGGDFESDSGSGNGAPASVTERREPPVAPSWSAPAEPQAAPPLRQEAPVAAPPAREHVEAPPRSSYTVWSSTPGESQHFGPDDRT